MDKECTSHCLIVNVRSLFDSFASPKCSPTASGKFLSRTDGSGISKKVVFSSALNHEVVPESSSKNTHIVYFELIILTRSG